MGRTGRVVRASREERAEEPLASSTRVWQGSLVVNASTQVVKLALVWRTARVVLTWDRGEGALGEEERRKARGGAGREAGARGREEPDLATSASLVHRVGIRAMEYGWRMGLATRGLMALCSANDRVSLYLCLEWQALVLYVLACFTRTSARATEAGLKYFIQGSVMSGVYLFGMARVYGVYGTVSFTERRLRRREGGRPGVDRAGTVGLRRVLSTLRFKVAAVPFHAWAPDVYEGAPTSSGVYFAVVPKRAILSLRLRVLTTFQETQAVWQPRVRRVGVRSRVLAPLAARAQRKWKRFLAYSSIANVGILRMGVGVGGFAGHQAVWLYGRVYSRTALAIWVSRASVVKREGEGDTGRTAHPALFIHELDGLAENNPILAYTIGVGILSSAGLPPFVMFYAKRSILMAMSGSLRRRAIRVVRVSVVTTFYYLRFVKVRFFKTDASPKRVTEARTPWASRTLGRLRVGMVRLLVDSNLLVGLTTWMAKSSGA